MCIIHKWKTIYDDDPEIVQECIRCHKKRSSAYDMMYGCTYWVKGDLWGKIVR